MSATAHPRGVAEMIPIEHQTSDRVVRTMVFAVPPAALVVGGWLAWGGALHWQDLLVLAITYTLTGLGVTVGYHRLFTHRSFKTTRAVRALLAVLGSMAVEGPLIEWVATHRKHHRFSDRPGDPHSPHVDHAPGWRGALRGLATRTSAGCCAARRWPTPPATRRTCSPTVTCA
jgi:stearoyl-CoA desaturase (Delta-9 desaturase)